MGTKYKLFYLEKLIYLYFYMEDILYYFFLYIINYYYYSSLFNNINLIITKQIQHYN